ncbi:hypothetical protein H072_6668 [Dactylellina haptotyla CBS 200.50]|uniref:Uncharacterized protein n=1 Tax=Dactylellina haptotyla (strain CBS 200.50) TaxID=1284197 RepID=S8A938_DACHA|nr:hypothetical protein H072_6668 [Dactylellina haptotyla CBS 200.50]
MRLLKTPSAIYVLFISSLLALGMAQGNPDPQIPINNDPDSDPAGIALSTSLSGLGTTIVTSCASQVAQQHTTAQHLQCPSGVACAWNCTKEIVQQPKYVTKTVTEITTVVKPVIITTTLTTTEWSTVYAASCTSYNEIIINSKDIEITTTVYITSEVSSTTYVTEYAKVIATMTALCDPVSQPVVNPGSSQTVVRYDISPTKAAEVAFSGLVPVPAVDPEPLWGSKSKERPECETHNLFGYQMLFSGDGNTTDVPISEYQGRTLLGYTLGFPTSVWSLDTIPHELYNSDRTVMKFATGSHPSIDNIRPEPHAVAWLYSLTIIPVDIKKYTAGSTLRLELGQLNDSTNKVFELPVPAADVVVYNIELGGIQVKENNHLDILLPGYDGLDYGSFYLADLVTCSM